MNDYGTLAEILKSSGDEQQRRNRDLSRHQFDLGSFFEEVKAQIIQEMGKANAELRRQGLAEIERVLVPCYLGRLCLTFGAVLLCCVDFDRCTERITSVIVGPPNRREISRQAYSLSRELARIEASSAPGAERNANRHSPAAIAGEIVSEIIETGIRLTQKPLQQIESASQGSGHAHFAEFWISLASLLRSYTALHGLNGSEQAEIEASAQSIAVRRGKKLLLLERDHAIVTWTRENGNSGAREFTDHGSLRGPAGEEAMDLAAEQWARELMQEAEGTR